MEITYKDLEGKDIPSLTPIMKAAFDEDTRMHTELLADGPAGYDTGELLERLLKKENSISRVISCDGRVIGEYTIIKDGGSFTLDLFFLDPEYASRGIGTIVWNHIEQSYPEAGSWYLETPSYSTRNRHFYEKCGFRAVRENTCGDGAKSLVFVKRIASGTVQKDFRGYS